METDMSTRHIALAGVVTQSGLIEKVSIGGVQTFIDDVCFP
jgi:hypothetical protein